MSTTDARLAIRRYLHGRTPADGSPTFDQGNRVVRSSELIRIAAPFMGATTPHAISTFVARLTSDLADEGLVIRVRRGLFLNAASDPPAALAEAARFIRKGAVVSMQTVLGETVLNNPTPYVYCVVPDTQRRRAAEEKVFSSEIGHDGALARFVFYPVPFSVLEAGDLEDRLVFQAGWEADPPYLKATPEAALVHWIWLGDCTRSGVSGPPAELDLDEIDLDRLGRLATAVGLQEQADTLIAKARLAAQDDDRPGCLFGH